MKQNVDYLIALLDEWERDTSDIMTVQDALQVISIRATLAVALILLERA